MGASYCRMAIQGDYSLLGSGNITIIGKLLQGWTMHPIMSGVVGGGMIQGRVWCQETVSIVLSFLIVITTGEFVSLL